MKHTLYLAGGCFWGTQKFFDCMDGVLSTRVGYANGNTENPSYEQVKYDHTGHAETVEVLFDDEVLSMELLLNTYYQAIDPTAVNRQGPDVGIQYRTGIYYTDEADRPVIEASLKALEETLGEKVAVECEALSNFYEAEEYHQKYLEKNPNGYCHLSASHFELAKKANKH